MVCPGGSADRQSAAMKNSFLLVDFFSGLVVVADANTLVVELQFHAVRQFHVITITFLVNLCHRGATERGFHILLDGGGNESGGNSNHVAAYLVPIGEEVFVLSTLQR